ncbi:MAG: hypothetical protein GWP18_02715 [Proteobacteria bacterium]|nr:hypothetical protein [Pseudomonadota bacterium]
MDRELTATPIERDVVTVSGADAGEYLQTQLTQDVVGLDEGESAWSFILTPKSEIEAIVRVTRAASDALLLDVAPGMGSTVRGRLDGMLFRMDVSFLEETWSGIAWRGNRASERAGSGVINSVYPETFPDALDVLGPDRMDPPSDVPALPAEDLDAWRIAARWPSDADFDGSVTPAMTGLVDLTVNFEKGCYTGQEFVARVHYRDALPPRRLISVAFVKGTTVVPGSEITIDGEVVGTLTSSSAVWGIGLGYLKRSVDLPAEAECSGVAVALSA